MVLQGAPVMTEGLIARNLGGTIKFFDSATNVEVTDIATHQYNYKKNVCELAWLFVSHLRASLPRSRPPSP